MFFLYSQGCSFWSRMSCIYLNLLTVYPFPSLAVNGSSPLYKLYMFYLRSCGICFCPKRFLRMPSTSSQLSRFFLNAYRSILTFYRFQLVQQYSSSGSTDFLALSKYALFKRLNLFGEDFTSPFLQLLRFCDVLIDDQSFAETVIFDACI